MASSTSRTLGLELSVVATDGPDDFDAAFADLSRNRPDAISGADSPLNIGNRSRVIGFVDVCWLTLYDRLPPSGQRR